MTRQSVKVGGVSMRKNIMIVLAVLCILAYGILLYMHDSRMEAAIETETEFTFNRGYLYDNQ